MSRSYRKPWIVDRAWKYWGKRWANKKVRRLPVDELGNGMQYKRHYESYDICDYKWQVDKDDEFFDKSQRK